MDNTKRYYLPDLESGFDYEVDQYTYERWLKMKELFAPKIKSSDRIGNIVIIGTMSDNDDSNNNDFYRDLFINAGHDINDTK